LEKESKIREHIPKHDKDARVNKIEQKKRIDENNRMQLNNGIRVRHKQQ